VKNGWYVNWGEHVGYGHIQSCRNESSSITVVAINRNSIGGRVLGFVGDKTTRQWIEMGEGERKRVLELLQQILHETLLIHNSCRLLEEQTLLDIVRRQHNNIPRS